jgi:hypothetical protein
MIYRPPSFLLFGLALIDQGVSIHPTNLLWRTVGNLREQISSKSKSTKSRRRAMDRQTVRPHPSHHQKKEMREKRAIENETHVCAVIAALSSILFSLDSL